MPPAEVALAGSDAKLSWRLLRFERRFQLPTMALGGVLNLLISQWIRTKSIIVVIAANKQSYDKHR